MWLRLQPKPGWHNFASIAANIILGTSDLGFVKDTPGTASLMSSCIAPPPTSLDSPGVHLKSGNLINTYDL